MWAPSKPPNVLTVSYETWVFLVMHSQEQFCRHPVYFCTYLSMDGNVICNWETCLSTYTCLLCLTMVGHWKHTVSRILQVLKQIFVTIWLMFSRTLSMDLPSHSGLYRILANFGTCFEVSSFKVILGKTHTPCPIKSAQQFHCTCYKYMYEVVMYIRHSNQPHSISMIQRGYMAMLCSYNVQPAIVFLYT